MAYVLDTTAVVAVLLGEPEGLVVTRMLDRVRTQREHVLLPFMTMMEAQYKLERDYDAAAAAAAVRLIRAWPVAIIESDPEWGAAAARVRARGGLSLGDAWIASLALMHDAQLVHRDAEFERVQGLRSLPLR